MSSEVMTPVNFLLSSTTGRVSRLYLSKSSATSFSLALARVEISGSWVSESMARVGAGQHQLGEGYGSCQGAVGIHQIDRTDGFNSALKAPQDLDGIVYRGNHGNRQILGIHQAGGGVFLELQEFDHFLAFLRFHLQQDFRGAFFGQIGQQVGGRVRFHLLHDLSGTFGIERLENRLLYLGLDFLQGSGCHFLIQGLKHRLAFVRSQVFDDIGDVGGVQSGQALVGNLELYPAGGIGLDQVNEVPGNAARRDLPQQRPQRHQGNHTLQQSPDGAAGADIHRADFQHRTVADGFLQQVQIVYPDDFPAEDVDDLLVQKITSQQQHAFRAIAVGPVGRGRIGTNAPVDRGDGYKGQHAVAATCLYNQNRNPGPVFLGNQGHFAHPAASASGGVKHRSAQQFGKRKGQHSFENTQLTGKNPQELSVSFASFAALLCELCGKGVDLD